MFDRLISDVKRQSNISNEGMEKFISALSVRYVKKKKNILNEGNDADCMFYVNEGLFRCYIFDENGNEHTTDLIPENNWFGDSKAFLTHTKATINIEAIEDSQVFVLSYTDLHRFYDEIPMFERAVRKIIEHYFIKAIEKSKRVSHGGYSAQKRYDNFLKRNKKIGNRVPAIYLASYLGLTPETLSRLRNNSGKG
jgi:CRP-like cAMP-binding protein